MKYSIDYDNTFLAKRINYEVPEPEFPRAPFQRDRDRIMHSRAFRRMMHKTQVFNATIGDHYRNRLTHTLEVSQIARSIGKALELNDELIEAIALGHDLGHTPYGHIGERTLDSILRGKVIEEIKDQNDGFKHNLQSLRIVDELETRCSDYNGINLTLAVREGIVKHTEAIKNSRLCQDSNNDYTGMKLGNPFSLTLEGQVVAVADEIAQYTHDLEDSVRSGIITIDDVIKFPIIKEILCKISGIDADKYKDSFPNDPTFHLRTIIIRDYIGYLINDVIRTSTEKIEMYFSKYSPRFSKEDDCMNERCIVLSGDVQNKAKDVYDEITSKVICSENISIADSKSEYVIIQLFKAFYKHPKQLPDYILSRYFTRKGLSLNRFQIDDDVLRKDPNFIRSICDHISGMTDQFAAREYKRLYMP